MPSVTESSCHSTYEPEPTNVADNIQMQLTYGVSQSDLETAGTSSSTEPRIPPRLQTSLDATHTRDIYSPLTPMEGVMAQYADPTNLPGPTSHSETHVSFGSVAVPKGKENEYGLLRQHMANSDRGKKYLAFVENRSIETEVYPHNDYAPSRSLDGLNEYEAGNYTTTDDTEKKAIVSFATDRGTITSDGGTLSPATTAAHEMGHAARMFVSDPETGELANPPEEKFKNDWVNSEEQIVIRNLEHPVALSNGETGNRDRHGYVTDFRVDGFTSALPSSEYTRQMLTQYAPTLQEYTAQMDKEGTGPFETKFKYLRRDPELAAQHPLLMQRQNTNLDLLLAIFPHEQLMDVIKMHKQGISAETIAGRLDVPKDQIHQKLDQAVVDLNAQGYGPEAIATFLHLTPENVQRTVFEIGVVNYARLMTMQGIADNEAQHLN